jgi:hypothetical protein
MERGVAAFTCRRTTVYYGAREREISYASMPFMTIPLMPQRWHNKLSNNGRDKISVDNSLNEVYNSNK